MSMAAEQLAVELARVADDMKCEDVTVMDLRGRSPVTDFFIVCTGSSDRQMHAAADEIISHAKKLGVRPFGRSNTKQAEWLLVDLIDVVVHIFTGEKRRYYDLELLWGDAPRITWSRSASA